MKNSGERVKVNFTKNQTFQKYFFIIALLIIPVANWAIFWLAVNVQSIGMAFLDGKTQQFTWWNFEYFWQQLTLPGGEIGIAVKNTATYFAANLLITLPFAMVMAFFLYKQIFGNKVFMIIFYLPAVISQVAMVSVYKDLWSAAGPIAQLLGDKSFIPPEGLFNAPETATWFIVLFNVWTSFGTDILLFIGAMARIPLEVFEAAKLEGCKPGRELISIIVPLIWPTFSTMLILAFTGLFSATGPILLFGADSAPLQTTTIDYWIFKEVWKGGVGGQHAVSATGLAFTCVAVPLILFVRWLAEKVPNNEY